MPGYVYILANQKYGTLYIGVTSDLVARVYDHRERRTPGFAWKYGCKRLVWHEEHDRIVDAIQREKSLKRWYRQWKIELIEGINPNWDDLQRSAKHLLNIQNRKRAFKIGPRVKPEDDGKGRAKIRARRSLRQHPLLT